MYNYSAPKRITVITGHYGAGKTNVAVNLAKRLAAEGRKVALVDLDIVNPYFRSADNREELEALGVRCVVPEYANSNVDIPSLPADIYAVLQPGGDLCTVLDVGGDDAGATALAVYAAAITACGYEMLCVVNRYRPLTAEPEDAVTLLREIEKRSRLRVTGIVNNSNLGRLTDRETVEDARAYGEAVSRISGIPLVMTTVMEPLAQEGDFPLRQATKQLF